MFAGELRVPRIARERSFDESEFAQRGGGLGVFELGDRFFLASVFQGGDGRWISERKGLLQNTESVETLAFRPVSWRKSGANCG